MRKSISDFEPGRRGERARTPQTLQKETAMPLSKPPLWCTNERDPRAGVQVQSPPMRQSHRAGDRRGGADSPSQRIFTSAARGQTPMRKSISDLELERRGERAMTPQTLRKETVQPVARREAKSFRVSSPMATSPVGMRESSALAQATSPVGMRESNALAHAKREGGNASPLPYRYNMAAKQILDSGAPSTKTPSPTSGSSLAGKWLNSAAERRDVSESPSPTARQGEQLSVLLKENLSPDSRSAATKTLPIGTNSAKNILSTRDSDSPRVAPKVRKVEAAKKTTKDMHMEMMQLFNEAKKSGTIIEVRSTSKSASDSPEVIKVTKISSRRKTKEEMHAEMMQLFEEAKASGSVIEVQERPEKSYLFPPPACVSPGPLSGASMLNRVSHSGPRHAPD